MNNVQALVAAIAQGFCMKAHETVMDLDVAEPINASEERWFKLKYDMACQEVEAFTVAGIVPQF